MLRSHKLTLLYIGHEGLARCDFDRRGKRRGLWTRPRPVAGELPEFIDIAANLDRSSLGDTWILAADLWTHRLAVGRDQFVGLSTAEVSRALAFEAESLSGQSALDSDLGILWLDGTGESEEYWGVLVPHWIRDQAEATIGRGRGRLVGILHPGGAPGRIASSSNPTGSWGRVERWGGVTVAVGFAPDAKHCVTLAGGDSRSAAWGHALGRWRTSLGLSAELEQLAESAQIVGADFGAPLNLSEIESLEAWLAVWARSFAISRPPVPFVVPPKRPVSARTRYIIGATLLLLVAGMGLSDHLLTRDRIERLQLQIRERRRTEQELANAKKELTDLEKKLAEENIRLVRLQKEVPPAEVARGIYRKRWSELLGLLADSCPQDVVIRELSREGRRPTIYGASLGLEPLNELTVRFGRRLAPLGWSLVPHYEVEQISNSGRPLYRFRLELVHRQIDGESKALEPIVVAAGGLAP